MLKYHSVVFYLFFRSKRTLAEYNSVTLLLANYLDENKINVFTNYNINWHKSVKVASDILAMRRVIPLVTIRVRKTYRTVFAKYSACEKTSSVTYLILVRCLNGCNYP